jgi:hypothetical protein
MLNCGLTDCRFEDRFRFRFVLVWVRPPVQRWDRRIATGWQFLHPQALHILFVCLFYFWYDEILQTLARGLRHS